MNLSQTSSAETTSDTITVGPSARKRLWKVFWILLVITIFEVFFAFTGVPQDIKKWTFIALTIVKAYFIVGFFMHLKHERVHLAWTIVLPFLLILYFIYMMMYEGNALNEIRTVFEQFISK